MSTKFELEAFGVQVQANTECPNCNVKGVAFRCITIAGQGIARDGAADAGLGDGWQVGSKLRSRP
jgi:hypothetical protein